MNPSALKHVLIVEDQHLVRAGMIALIQLTEPNSQVVGVANHDDAIELLERQPFDVVFLDIDLRGDKSGMDVLRYIRERDMLTRAIMLSASEDADTVLGCIAAGASGYMAKGQGDASTFRRALTTVFSDGVYLPASTIRREAHPEPPAVKPHQASELGLSPRLYETLYYMCQGLTNKAIARHMNITESTVRKNHVSELLRFFNVTRRTELVVEVARRGIQVQPPAQHHAPPASRPD